ncbi:hypothetical protein [Mucilaginibacter lacusdianchii]|uniref:hypothetical protein n=1 Tax=Mucilaginibacter lacusdianchii TaxID=2684211 RepID=UPI00131AE93A|nr:hypothetical protein [Mucilaginibacter sp. JXJ CY 39]
MSYNAGYAGAADPGAAIGLVAAQFFSPLSGAPVYLNTSQQRLTSGTGLAVTVGNKQTFTQKFSVSALNLKIVFCNKAPTQQCYLKM